MRSNRLDRLKFSAAIAVVLLHGVWLSEVHPYADQLTTNGIFRIAVPIFVVISGFFFARRPHNSRPAWLWKLVMLYIFWMALYSPYWATAHGDSTSLIKTAITAIYGYFHLWYLPALIFAGFFTHFFGEKRWFAGIAFALGCIGVALQYLAMFNSFPHQIYRNGAFFLLPLFAIGFFLGRQDRLPTPTPVVAVIAFIAVATESTILWFFGNGRTIDIMLSLYVSAPIFVLISLKGTAENDISRNPIYSLSDWIYFTHPFFIVSLRDYFDPFLTSLLSVGIVVGLGLATMNFRRSLSLRGIPV